MAGFRRKERRGMPEMNTSSLPDLIFTILFFFMMVTTMREVTLKVKFTIPAGTELEKLEKKSVVSFIYVGPPTDNLRAQMGSSTRIQLNDRFAEAKEVMDFVAAERQGMTNQAEQIISIKADQHTQMGYITDIKEVLRKSWALRINYSATKRNRYQSLQLHTKSGSPTKREPLFILLFSLFSNTTWLVNFLTR